ncbi:Gfo/Idh/MocA family protein [Roseimaritima sediminicola]|uniref:Gfo/Idh/MocA family protein n=1 Tax=Roseimaritima sediminicola TaxID=2662066 RepID=UPI00129838C5|nr:Gfo/Idh/MocA family oxidoreductase [Roseimaritima sediminicola]
MARVRIAAISFEHFHMGDLLRMAAEHPDAEVVGICDPQPERMQEAIANFGFTDDQVFTDYRQCFETTKPDVVMMCPAAADHGLWTERAMEYGVDAMVEKPMAASLAEADQMIAAAEKAGRRLMINWPLAWSLPHQTAYRLIGQGRIGQVIEVHYYGGNRGPLYHGADKRETTPEEIAREKPTSWFYKKASGGGSALDYMGYGTTLGTWYFGGQKPIEVTATVDEPEGLEVDEHCIAVARYASGLSKFETRWGTFTDPWTHQPQPQCGFVIVGTEGTIACYDYTSSITVQTREQPEVTPVPCEGLGEVWQDPIRYFLDCRRRDAALEGPSCPKISRIGQQIVDTAMQSAQQKRTVRLLGE